MLTAGRRRQLERVNANAEIGERITYFREHGMNWRDIAALEGISDTKARQCYVDYQSLSGDMRPINAR